MYVLRLPLYAMHLDNIDTYRSVTYIFSMIFNLRIVRYLL